MDTGDIRFELLRRWLVGQSLAGDAGSWIESPSPSSHDQSMQSKAKTVAEYMKGLPAAEKKVLTELRKAVKKGAPGCAEVMTYGMPTFELDGEMVCAFNMQKNYLCLYVIPEALDPHRAKFKSPKAGKCCVRFTVAKPMSMALAEELVRASAAMNGK